MDSRTEVDRRLVRRRFLEMASRRQRPGTGSSLAALDVRRMTMDWWREADRALRGVPHAVGGAVAANAYAPERSTRDIDLLVLAADGDRAGRALRAAGWEKVGALTGIAGSSWRNAAGHDLGLIGVGDVWGTEAIEAAQTNVVEGMPTLTLPYLVWMKLSAARTIDLADISRILGRASGDQLRAARELVRRLGTNEDVADFDQLLQMGRPERFGSEGASGDGE